MTFRRELGKKINGSKTNKSKISVTLLGGSELPDVLTFLEPAPSILPSFKIMSWALRSNNTNIFTRKLREMTPEEFHNTTYWRVFEAQVKVKSPTCFQCNGKKGDHRRRLCFKTAPPVGHEWLKIDQVKQMCLTCFYRMIKLKNKMEKKKS